MNRQRVEELALIISNQLIAEIDMLNRMANERMPEVVINKHKEDVAIYEDMLNIFREYLDMLKAPVCDTTAAENVDMVNQPIHYNAGQYEVLDVIKDWLTEEEFRGYIKGNMIKYIARERYKNGDEDMQKAEFYIHYLNTGGEKGIK